MALRAYARTPRNAASILCALFPVGIGKCAELEYKNKVMNHSASRPVNNDKYKGNAHGNHSDPQRP
jgi:hypothetical protein